MLPIVGRTAHGASQPGRSELAVPWRWRRCEGRRPCADDRQAQARAPVAPGVLAYQGAVRAMIAATITRPELAPVRPGLRFGLIDQALAPLDGTLTATDPAGLAQLKRDLAAVVSAEALFVLTDRAGLAPDDAIASLVGTETTITKAALE